MKKFGKIIKYELLNSGRILLPIYGTIIILSLVLGLMFDFDPENLISESLGAIFSIIYLTISVLSTASVIVTLTQISGRFKKSMTQSEAYLTHTLPVTTDAIIAGKFITALIWVLLCSLTQLISGMFVVARLFFTAQEHPFTTLINDIFVINGINYTVPSILMFIAMLLSFSTLLVGIIYSCIAIKHLINGVFNKFSGLVGFIYIIFFVINFPLVMGKIIFFCTEHMPSNEPGTVFACLGIMCIVSIVAAAIMFVITDLIFRKRLNVE